ncbi:integrase arm-type DNA-binding domain-containing protein [Novosphingobium sp. BL-8H]|uniref:tyrosine-type recombinase/integrase n=1 Tax=Novosphingobium sp. BL-8H TaxID=3127640 RepID=UPI003756CC7B
MSLKELEVKYATKRRRPYKLADGGGLHVLVQPTGSKLWRMKYRFAGKEKLLSFGKYPEVSMASARAMRDTAKALLAEGKDPGAARKASAPAPALNTNSFEVIARQWHANRIESLNETHASRLLNRFERDVFPSIGARPIVEITAPEILKLIQVVENRGALDVSRRIKQSIGQVFRFAIANGWATNDPSIHLTGALKPRPKVRHMARLPLQRLPELVQAINAYDGDEDPRRREITREALLFTLLTWCRTSETRFAAWHEFEELDGTNPIWRIPGERMKMDREHIVPLSHQAVDLLRRQLRATNGEGLVFPGTKVGKPISQNTMIYACYRMGYRGRQTVHGFRGMASTWANEQEVYNSDWIELALAHSEEDDIRGAYNSALYLTPRRRMLQHWADTLSRAADNQALPPERGVMKAEAPAVCANSEAGNVVAFPTASRFQLGPRPA